MRIYCPFCKQEREESEFHYAGEAFVERPEDPAELSDKQWADYLFMRKNIKGMQWEQWTHAFGCRKFFAVQRNTANHQKSRGVVLESVTEEEKNNES